MSLFIETKQKGFTGTKSGVFFANGKARVPKAVAQALIKKGVCYCEALGKSRPVEKAKVKTKTKAKK